MLIIYIIIINENKNLFRKSRVVKMEKTVTAFYREKAETLEKTVNSNLNVVACKFSNGKSNILIETLSTNICILSSWLSMVAAFSEIYSVFYSPPSSSLNPPYILATGNLFPAFFSSLSSFFSRPRTALLWLLFGVWVLFVNWFQRDPRYVSVMMAVHFKRVVVFWCL